MFITHVALVGTQLNIFLTTPTIPVHVSTRHEVEAHLQSSNAFCDTWYSPRNYKHTPGVLITHVSLVGTPTFPAHGSTRPLPFLYMAQQGMQWKHICSILQSPNAFCDTWQCPRNYTNSTLVYHTHVSLVGTQLNIFLFTPTLPIHVS